MNDFLNLPRTAGGNLFWLFVLPVTILTLIVLVAALFFPKKDITDLLVVFLKLYKVSILTEDEFSDSFAV